MSSIYHTPIPYNTIADEDTFNSPMSQLDAHLDDAMSFGVNNNAELAAARSPYTSLAARLAAITFGYVGGNIATLANGAASAGQKNVTVDSTTGFLVGAFVAYELVGGAVEYNTIASITPTTVLTLGTNIGTGGIADNSYIGMISVSEYQAANVINHGSTALTLPQTIEYAAGGVFNVKAYGATGDGSTDETAAIQATWDAMSDKDTLLIPPGTYVISDTLVLKELTAVTIQASGAYIQTATGANFANKAMIDLCGNAYLRINGLVVQETLAANHPAAGLVLGRTATKTGGTNRLLGVTVEGNFTSAALYNVGAEVCSIVGCWLSNATAGADAVMFGNQDPASLTTVDAGMLTGWFNHCAILNLGGVDGAGRAVQLLGRCSDIAFRDCYFYVPNDGIVIETTGAAGSDACYNLTLDGNRVECNSGTYTNFRLVKVSGTNGMSYSRIVNNNISATGGYVVETTKLFSENRIEGNTGSDKLLKVSASQNVLKNVIRGYGAGKITIGSGATLADNEIYWFDNTWPFDSGADYGEHVIFTRKWFTSFGADDATPSVGTGDCRHFLTANSNPTTITAFDDGFVGQEIWVVFGDANTTLDFYPSTTLRGNAHVDRAMGQNDAIHAVFDGSTWFVTVIAGY